MYTAYLIRTADLEIDSDRIVKGTLISRRTNRNRTRTNRINRITRVVKIIRVDRTRINRISRSRKR